jgi:hypothetical protein
MSSPVKAARAFVALCLGSLLVAALDSSPAALESESAIRLHLGDSRAGYLEPDATLIATRTAPFAVLIEYDRTQRPHKQVDRLRRYDRWLLSSWRAGAYAQHEIPPFLDPPHL